MKKSLKNITLIRPLGRGGMGGIDRVVENELITIDDDEIIISETVTRGNYNIWLSPIFLLNAISQIFFRKIFNKVDLVHINLSSYGSVIRKSILIRLCLILKIKYTIHLHGSRFKVYWDNLNPQNSRRLKSKFEKAERVYVLGEYWKRYILSKAPKSKINILFNGSIPPKNFIRKYKEKETIRILFLGILDNRKGVYDLIEALKILKNKNQINWMATIAGNGDINECKTIIKQHNLDEHIDIPGWVSANKVELLLESSDILVLPSYNENLPMSVIEGMAYGLAIVTTPVGATESLIKDGVTGVIVQPGDQKALALSLMNLLNNYDEICMLGKAAKLFHQEHLDIKKHCYKLVNDWKVLINNDHE